METTHELLIYGTGTLPCPITELEDALFARIEGFGAVTGSGVGRGGWNLDVVFESPNAFTAIIEAVQSVLTELDADLTTVTVRVRGKRHRLVDLL